MSHDVTDFQKEVLDRSFELPVLVDFWAEWCGPCRVLGPVLDKPPGETGVAWELAKLDTETFPEISARYGIRSIPNVKLFIEGKVAAEFTGALPESAVRQWLGKEKPRPQSGAVEEAETLLLDGRVAEAQQTLEGVLQEEPSNERARVLYAQSFLDSDPSRARDIVAPIEMGSPFDQIADAIRTFALCHALDPDTLPEHPVRERYIAAIESLNSGDFDSALESFIDVIRRNRYYDDDGSRKACISIFKILGEDHEVTLKYRRDFNGSLY